MEIIYYLIFDTKRFHCHLSAFQLRLHIRIRVRFVRNGHKTKLMENKIDDFSQAFAQTKLSAVIVVVVVVDDDMKSTPSNIGDVSCLLTYFYLCF